MRDPSAVDLLGDTETSLIETVEDLGERLREVGGYRSRRDLRTALECAVNEVSSITESNDAARGFDAIRQ